jgi:hypothetical protein
LLTSASSRPGSASIAARAASTLAWSVTSSWIALIDSDSVISPGSREPAKTRKS